MSEQAITRPLSKTSGVLRDSKGHYLQGMRSLERRSTFTHHVRDLMGRNMAVIIDICEYVAKKDKRQLSKIMVARWLAAQTILRAPEQPSFLKEINERNEGKVPDQVNINQRLISFTFTLNPPTLGEPDNNMIEGQALSSQPTLLQPIPARKPQSRRVNPMALPTPSTLLPPKHK